MLPERPGWKMVWLGLANTPAQDGYLYIINEVRNSQTAVFDGRLTIGPADQDSDSFISTLSMGDWSGGGQISEMSGADQSRYWWGIFDGRSPHQAALPPRVYNPDGGKPSGATGTSYPLGVVNNTAYFAFGTDICGYNESGGVWYTKESLGHAPVSKGVSFHGKLFVPCGINGYKIIEESGTGNPTVTAVAGSAPPTVSDPEPHNNPYPVAFHVAEANKLFALTTNGTIAWTLTGTSGQWDWDFNDGDGVYPALNSSFTPYGLKAFFNRNGIPTLFVNHSSGVHSWDRGNKVFNETAIIVPNFPHTARCMEVWRPGEDLWVSMGLDVIHYTAANTTIPLSGVNRDSGLPVSYRGAIVDLQAEMSALYALVGGTSELYRSFEYVAKTGANGTGNGQFSGIQAVAVDSSENIYAADLNNERIQKFNSSLTYQAKTSGGAGDGNGDFASDDGIYDLAVDGSNNLWAVDTANHRIQQFNSSLTYQSQIDGRVSVLTMNTYSDKYGTSGTGNSNLDAPVDIAVNSSGTQYVADQNNARIIVRDSSNVFVFAITLPASTYKIWSVCTDPSDNIYALCRNSTGPTVRLLKYTSAYALLFNVAIPGTTADGAMQICSDGAYVHLVHGSSRLLGSYNVTTGAPVRVTTWNTGFFPTSLDCTGGSLYIAGYGATNYLVNRYNANTLIQSSTIATGLIDGVTAGTFSQPRGISVSPVNGNVFVSDGVGNYVSEFTVTGTYVQRFGGTGTGDGQFQFPMGSTFNVAGTKLHVADATNDRVQRFVTSTTLTSGSGDTNFNRPKYMAINRDQSDLWIVDSGNLQIKRWAISGTPAWAQTITPPIGATTGAFGASGIGRIAVSQDASSAYLLYIVDPTNKRVNIYNSSGTAVGSIGSSGTGDGQFMSPVGVAISEQTGNLFVSDDSRDDVQEFTSAGAFVRSFVTTGTGNGQVTGPVGIGAGRTDAYFYITDNTQSRFTQFLDSDVTDSESSIPHLQRWTGIGWQGTWEGVSGVTPTWMNVVNVVGAYYLCWGADDGNIYRMRLEKNGIHNPRQLLTPFALGDYATTGYIETSETDMNMLGFKKIASHVKLFMRSATINEKVLAKIAFDDGPWEELGYATTQGLTNFPINTQTVSETSETASLGRSFTWVKMGFDMYRGNDPTQTPIIRSVNLHFLKIPQNTTTYAFDVVLPKERTLGRDGREISDYINSLLTANEMVLMKHQGRLFRGRLSNVTGIDNTGEDMAGIRSINFLEISDIGGS